MHVIHKGPVKLIQPVKIAHSFLQSVSILFHFIILSLPMYGEGGGEGRERINGRTGSLFLMFSQKVRDPQISHLSA